MPEPGKKISLDCKASFIIATRGSKFLLGRDDDLGIGINDSLLFSRWRDSITL